ncbi:hypothetical protein [Anabaena sp. PCC 7108]|uniref:hypothetical protein n=1 Tax=Anabaena sp. PCC 7108 TaxID=163908 RepID=UPI00034970E3|nr:hypothetical protein [Anabaena sp. PCC 7108]
MSKSNRSKYFLNNPNNTNIPLLRDELHKALSKEEFIVEIPVTEDEIIEITEKNANAKLKKVSIQKLNYVDEKCQVKKIWKINLEKDIPGISTSSRTTECAILVLQKYESSYRLNIILIELKSSIDNKELEKIEEKFSSAMSRVCMLLVLNNHLNPKQGYNEEEIYVDFKGILFYKIFSEKRKSEGENYSQLYSILHTSNKSGTLTCQTILREQDKIKVQCFCHQDNDLETEIRKNLKDLL